MPITKQKIALSFVLGLMFILLPSGLVWAAYERFSPSTAVSISEFVYNDDYTVNTGDCTLTVLDPNGDAFALPGGSTMSVDVSTGRHYKNFTLSALEGVWPATMSCGTGGVDLAKLDKTFIVGYVNASTTAISNSVWSNTSRTLTTFGSVVADTATAVWSSLSRTLTSRQIGGGAEYIAGVTSGFLVTQVASSAEVDSLETDLTTVKNNVATLITEIGTSQISAIKTKTDSIVWSDVTGLVTSNGEIKAKTDTIDWTDVTDIKTKTDTIAWGDVTGIKLKTDTILWTDVTTAKNNVATLITEVGTGQISGIKTKTDTIAWGDVTGIVTATGAIQAKTDTIDWTNVTGIKTKTDTILWTDVTGIKTKTDTILWTDITSVKAAQEAGWTVSMSNITEVLAGDTYRAKVYTNNYQSVPTNSFTAPAITLYDPDRNTIVSAVAMTNLSNGVYEYTYVVSSGATQGLWESSVSIQVESGKTIQANDYWSVAGSPAQVIINGITDDSIPTIDANVTITNEGLTGYEYQYEWCVVSNSNNACGGGDDTFYASAAKYINAGEDWNTTLSSTVSVAGDYYFKLVVYFGTDSSGASRSFTAVSSVGPTCGNGICGAGESCSSCSADCGSCSPGGGGGGGGGGGTPPPVVTPPVCDGADFNHDKKVNSIDFSILLTFWKTVWPFRNTCVDVNSDKQVNTIDFSILMYQWGSKK